MAVKTASVLAFERKLANSDALLYAGRWENRGKHEGWEPITIQTKSVRGTISNRLKAALQQDPAKLDAEIQKANLQTVDVAALSFEADTLRVHFSLRVLGNLSQPSACNNQDYQNALAAVINTYTEAQGFKELSLRYAANLANSRFLWRNRVGAEAIEVQVRQMQGGKALKTWTFDGLCFDLRHFTTEPSADLKSLAEVIAAGLMGSTFVLLEVEGFVRLGIGQEVFPSQELILDKGNEKGGKSKTLYQVDEVAAMHSQKIGNALRTLDTWYPQEEKDAEHLGPLAVEPYGSVTNRGKAYRQPKDKADFYSLLDNWVVKNKVPSVEQQHYVMAVLLRGGVFGEKGE